jgi:hypothetical protein
MTELVGSNGLLDSTDDHVSISILDNGGTPYTVVVTPMKKRVDIYLYSRWDKGIESEPTFIFQNVPRVYVGQNTATKQFDHAKQDPGNTVLIQTEVPRQYVFVNRDIDIIQTCSPVDRYVSPIGNSDVPYPYAMTQSQHVYLPNEGVYFALPEDCDDPYRYYYTHSRVEGFQQIRTLYGGNDSIMFRTSMNPEFEYHRLSAFVGGGYPLQVQYEDGRHRVLDYDDYISLIRAFNREKGLYPIPKIGRLVSSPFS